MTIDWTRFERARSEFPVGSHVIGTVSLVPHPGRVGVFVRVHKVDSPAGFVDGLNLPVDVNLWPSVGDILEFEVTQHTVGQVRLRPVDPSKTSPIYRRDDAAWAKLKSQYHIGQLVQGRTMEAYTSNRQYVVDFETHRSVVDYHTSEPPVIGDIHTYRVVALLDSTQLMRLDLES